MAWTKSGKWSLPWQSSSTAQLNLDAMFSEQIDRSMAERWPSFGQIRVGLPSFKKVKLEETNNSSTALPRLSIDFPPQRSLWALKSPSRTTGPGTCDTTALSLAARVFVSSSLEM
uniref:(northern house mosquito) hypothetical protein n=1 Tax=Culex pipiens TaxID=7175 RepID=A0A8D8CIK9_CULPI